MNKPFYYLSFPIEISEEWKSVVNVNDNIKQSYKDIDAKLVKDESRRILEEVGIVLECGQLWNWPIMTTPPPYHIDHKHTLDNPDNSLCAINTLLQGTPTFQEWTIIEKCQNVKMKTQDEMKTRENAEIYFAPHLSQLLMMTSSLPPEYSAELIKGYSLLCRVDIPHRVRSDLIKETRWSYSLRLYNRQKLRPTYLEIGELLKDYIVY